MNDSQIITACKKQDRSAQKVLYERYAPKMMAVCLRYCKDYETARDLLHDGFLQVFSQIGSYAGKGSFEGWLRKIFVNVALEDYRQKQREITFHNEFGQNEAEFAEEGDGDGDMLDIGDVPREEIMKIIQELPDGYRTVFNLVIFEDLSHKEIASRLGISEGSSRSQFFRAKEILQKRVQSIIKREYL